MRYDNNSGAKIDFLPISTKEKNFFQHINKLLQEYYYSPIFGKTILKSYYLINQWQTKLLL